MSLINLEWMKQFTRDQNRKLPENQYEFIDLEYANTFSINKRR